MNKNTTMESVLQRLQRLEDIEEIRQLKARYLHGCDRKHVENIRNCFASGTVVIDYGAIGCFSNRDDFVAVYSEMACRPNIIDIHHGHNEQIQWLSPEQASASWDLFFYQIDTYTGTLTQLGGYYDDQFQKIDAEWKIIATRFNITSTQVSSMAGGELKPLFSGATPPAA